MNDIIKDKIEQIEKFIIELEPNIPESFEEYERDVKAKAICERYFEKIVEAVVDMAFLIIKEKKLKIPKEDRQVFIILSENSVIEDKLALKLKSAKSMRNILAHEYGHIDDELVFYAVKNELIDDVNKFIEVVGEEKMKIKKYKESDEEEVKNMINTIRKEIGRSEIKSFDPLKKFTISFVAEEDNKIVSTLAFQDNGDGTGELWRVYTNKDYRGRGIASALLKEAEKEAVQKGIKKIKFYTYFAKEFYEKNGYVVTEVKEGKTYMEKEL